MAEAFVQLIKDGVGIVINETISDDGRHQRMVLVDQYPRCVGRRDDGIGPIGENLAVGHNYGNDSPVVIKIVGDLEFLDLVKPGEAARFSDDNGTELRVSHLPMETKRLFKI